MSSLLILYGSETGNAQDTAESLRREAILQNLSVRLMSLDEYQIETLALEAIVVFVVSTTGQGEFPPNARTTWKSLLRASLSKTWLSEVGIAVIGLGDSSYQKYNFAGKKIYRRLLQLGANQLVPLGLADDQHELGIDGELTEWRKILWESVYKSGKFIEMLPQFDPSSSIPAKYDLIYLNDGETLPDSSSVSTADYHQLTVLSNKKVTADGHFQDTRLVQFSTLETGEIFRYAPGDVLMIRPTNNEESMDIAFNALGYTHEQLNAPFILKPTDPFVKLPPTWLIRNPTTLRTCFLRLFDLQMIARKSFFEILGSLSSHPMEKEKLLELASPKGLDDLLDYCTRPRRTVAETLRDFPMTAHGLPIQRLFDLFSVIRPRAFSIASSMEAHHNVIELLVAKVEYKSRMAEPRRGLCSTFISRLKERDKVFAKIRAGTFRFPSIEKPVVCIGPGTGVAPFRSYLTSRDCRLENSSSDDKEVKSVLFFGCRSRTKDFYFAEEWNKLRTAEVHTAFSRDQEEKVYVQDVMLDHGNQLWDLIHNHNGSIFIAGSAGDMPKAVAAAIDEIATRNRGSNGSYSEELEKKGRIQYETWS